MKAFKSILSIIGPPLLYIGLLAGIWLVATHANYIVSLPELLSSLNDKVVVWFQNIKLEAGPDLFSNILMIWVVSSTFAWAFAGIVVFDEISTPQNKKTQKVLRIIALALAVVTCVSFWYILPSATDRMWKAGITDIYVLSGRIWMIWHMIGTLIIFIRLLYVWLRDLIRKIRAL